MNADRNSTKAKPTLTPADFGSHWNTTYYEIIQEYYWDPKLIGRVPAKPPIFANDREMLSSLRRMEVSLNHMLGLFFGLAPRDFIHLLEVAAFGDTLDACYRSVGIFELRRSAPHDPTQPDIFLASDKACFSLEVKIGAKSDLEQVVKYALLHATHDKRHGSAHQSRLLYLTPRPVGKTWKEGFEDVRSMQTALESFGYERFLLKSGMAHEISAEDLKAAAVAMEVSHMTFAKFRRITEEHAFRIPREAPYADCASALMDGLLSELDFRAHLLKLHSA